MLERFNRFKTWFSDSDTSNADRIASGVLILTLAILSWGLVWAAILLAIYIPPLFIFFVFVLVGVWALVQLELL